MDNLTRLLADSKYLLLTTFRRDGTPVPTPVWVVADGGSLAVWTPRDSGKVKRIRRSGAVQLAPCSRFGTPRGRSVSGRARLLDDGETGRVRGLLVRKYGLPGRAITAGMRHRRGDDAAVALSITVE